jgi:hypothetical protein
MQMLDLAVASSSSRPHGGSRVNYDSLFKA